MSEGQWLLLAVLLGLLALAAWYCISIWMATPAMTPYGNVIMGVAAMMALVAGSGLIALMSAIGKATITPRAAIPCIESELGLFVKR